MSLLGLLLGSMSGTPVVALAATYGVSDETISPANSIAKFKLTSGGDIIQTLVTAGATDLGDWITPKAAAGGAYECQSTVTSGSLTSDPSAGSWVALSSDREWTKGQTTVGTSQVIFTLKIRRAADAVELASCQVTLNATKSL